MAADVTVLGHSQCVLVGPYLCLGVCAIVNFSQCGLTLTRRGTELSKQMLLEMIKMAYNRYQIASKKLNWSQ